MAEFVRTPGDDVRPVASTSFGDVRETLGGGWDGTYHHQHDHEEPLLWLADAISWCWNKGGEWARRLDGIDMEVVELPRD